MNISQWRATLNSDEIVFYLIAASLMALACFGLVFYYLKRARLIEDTPTSKIRSAAQGYVELIGSVSAGEVGQLTAPLSGKTCVWFDYKIQRYRSSGKNGHWHTIKKGCSNQWFQITDNTGICNIDPLDAEVITEHSRTWYGVSEYPSQPNNNSRLLRILGGRRYRYIEKLIHVHDVIYALGNFQSLGGGRNIPSNHNMAGTVIREWKQNYNQILNQFDQDGNGEIDLQEWEQVREAAFLEAEKRRNNLSKMPTKHILSKMPKKQHPFILSTHSQKTLSKRFRYYAVGALIAGIIFSYLLLVLII